MAKNTEAKLDIPYGNDEKQKLDLYLPQAAKNAPVVVFVHGGEWSRHDKAEVSYKPKFLNEHGIIFASVNYRLSPLAKHPDQADDVASAVRWVHDHVARIRGRSTEDFPPGTFRRMPPRDSGGDRSPLLGQGQTSAFRPARVVAWSGGAYDLVQKVNDGGMYADYIKKTFGDSEDAWQDASPMAHVKNMRDGPPFLFISIKEGDASHKASERLAELIRKAKGNAESKLIEGRDHFNANHLLRHTDDSTGQILLDFVHRAVN